MSVAQKGKLDSLKRVANSSAGIQQASSFSEMAAIYIRTKSDSAKIFIEKAEKIYADQRNDTAKFQLFLRCSSLYQQAGDPKASADFLFRSKTLLNKSKLADKFRFDLYQRTGVRYHETGSYDSSLWYLNEAFPLAADSLQKIDVLRNLGLTYNSMGLPVKALDCYQQALAMLESGHYDDAQLASIYNNLGILYEDDGNLDKAEFYYKKAMEMQRKMNNKRRVFNVLNNLAILLSMQHKYEESLKCMMEAEALLPDIQGNNILLEAITNVNFGNTYTHMGNPKEGIVRFNKAIGLFVLIGDNYGVALCHRQLGEALSDIGKYREAEQHELEAVKMSKANGYGALLQDAYEDLSSIYGLTKQYDKAYRFHTIYTQMKDSTNDKQKQSKLGLLEKEFEIARNEGEKQRLSKENEINKARVESDRVAQWALGIVVALLIITVGAIAVAYRRTRTQNELLAEQKNKIEEQAEQLREAAKAKSTFFANVSHELRTPVTLLNGMLELMTGTHQQPSDDKLKIALGNSRRLQALVDEVLDLSRLEVGKAVLKKKPKEIVPVMNRIVMAFESLLVNKKIDLRYDVKQLNQQILDIDEDKFEKIINNLLYNAIKFNHENGWIEVTGTLDNNGKNVIITVTDSGDGIAESDIPHIFDRFYQGQSGKQVASQGIGIGLALVKEFTELHGGHVEVSNRAGAGASFVVQLPVHSTAEVSEQIAEPSEVEDVSFADLSKKPRILIVEDNEEMRFYLSEVLGKEIDLFKTSNGKEALDWLATNRVDLVISDVMMPVMDGYELLSKLKQHDRHKAMPVIMLTARASEEDLFQGLLLGVDDYLVKPFNARELKIRIRNLLRNQEIRREWLGKPAEKEEEIERNPADRQFMDKVEKFVEEHASNQNLGIGDLADHVAMSERQLYRKCGTVAGMTPAQLVKEIRMKIAYRLLTERKVTKVSDVASRVGFDNSAYFSKQFQERFGKRPVEFL